MGILKTLLLIAGRSKRFWPLSEKTLFPICGTNLLEITTGKLKSAGFSDITLVGGAHNLEEVSVRYPQFPAIEQKNLDLGMRGALLDALPSCGNEPVMIVCVNDVIDSTAYSSLAQAAKRPNVQGALLAQRVDRYFPGGYLKVEGDRILEVIEKPGEGNEPSNLVNIVAHVHNNASALLQALLRTSGEAEGGYERALTHLFANRIYHAVPYEGVWKAVKYPWHLLQLLSVLLEDIKDQQIHPTAEIHPTAVIDGNVVLKEGVKVMPHATVRGPCIIGPRSIVANNALVRSSCIGSDCVIGYSSEVKSSVIANHVWTHTTYIGNSVIGSNVSFGAGSVIGNFRLDEGEITSVINGEKVLTGLNKLGAIIGDNCRLGIHTGINPGKKIGAGSFINSHTLIPQDIPEKSFAGMKSGELVITENKSEVPRPEGREDFRQIIS